MEYLILGLLMVRKLTAYELHVIFKNNYQDICSDSIGNIQRALKKLNGSGQVLFHNFVEKGVNKNRYEITAAGRKSFLEWLNQPLDLTKAKNMELGRLLLLGFLPKADQLAAIEESIKEIRIKYDYLKAIEEVIKQDGSAIQNHLAYFQQNEAYCQGLLAAVEGDDLEEVMTNVDYFGKLTLKLGLDTMKFYLDWFEKLKGELKNGN